MRRRRRRHRPGAVGLRGRPERRRRHLRAGSSTHGVPAAYAEEAAGAGSVVHEHLTSLAARAAVGEHGLVALDWHSGNRSVLVDHELSGLVVGLTLATRPEEVYRALLEATAFGTRKIVESFETAGVPVARVRRRRRAAEEPLPHAALRRRDPPSAVADRLRAGAGARLGDPRRGRRRRLPGRPAAAARRWARRARPCTCPDAARADAYDALYAEYRRLHDYFGARRQRRDAPAARDPAGGGRGDVTIATRAAAVAAAREVARCTPSSCATGWSPGRAATSRPACPGRT